MIHLMMCVVAGKPWWAQAGASWAQEVAQGIVHALKRPFLHPVCETLKCVIFTRSIVWFIFPTSNSIPRVHNQVH
jgi:hypothetical protein